MTSPEFTVVMPCFRAGATIAAALDSVLGQTDPDFEIIVVEDGCPDGSGAQALRAAGHDTRLRLLREPNRGPAAARNTGAAAARGSFIAFLDSDDCWASDCLARHRAAFAADPKLGVSFAKVRFCDAALKWGGRLSGATGTITLAEALGDNPTCTTSNLVVRRDAFVEVGGFNPAMKYAEDQEFVVRIIASGKWRVTGIDAPLVDYRMSIGGLSADLQQMRAGWLAMLATARGLAPEAVDKAERRASALFHRYLARRALRTGQPAGIAFRFMITAIAANPLALVRHQPRRTLLTALGVLVAPLPTRLTRSLITR
jgi:hypothetical protein